MSRHLTVVLAAIAAAALVALPATAAKKKPAKEHDRLAPLTGQLEAPNPGDPDGYGAADFNIKGNKVCFRILAEGIEPVTAAHIHKAPPGQAGDIVVDLFSARRANQTLPPRISGCTRTTAALAKDIARNPDDYYVNVHNGPFPTGALRGQLSK
jgi:hypothetical protein